MREAAITKVFWEKEGIYKTRASPIRTSTVQGFSIQFPHLIGNTQCITSLNRYSFTREEITIHHDSPALKVIATMLTSANYFYSVAI